MLCPPAAFSPPHYAAESAAKYYSAWADQNSQIMAHPLFRHSIFPNAALRSSAILLGSVGCP